MHGTCDGNMLVLLLWRLVCRLIDSLCSLLCFGQYVFLFWKGASWVDAYFLTGLAGFAGRALTGPKNNDSRLLVGVFLRDLRVLEAVEVFDRPGSCAGWLERVSRFLAESDLRCLPCASAVFRQTEQCLSIRITLYVNQADDSSSPSSTTPAAQSVHRNASKRIYAVSHGAGHAAPQFCDVFLMTHDSPLLDQRDWSDLHDLFV